MILGHAEHSLDDAEISNDHIVIEEDMDGRLQRNEGDALCKPRNEFKQLSAEDDRITCSICVERAERYNVTIPCLTCSKPTLIKNFKGLPHKAGRWAGICQWCYIEAAADESEGEDE